MSCTEHRGNPERMCSYCKALYCDASNHGHTREVCLATLRKGVAIAYDLLARRLPLYSGSLADIAHKDIFLTDPDAAHDARMEQETIARREEP